MFRIPCCQAIARPGRPLRGDRLASRHYATQYRGVTPQPIATQNSPLDQLILSQVGSILRQPPLKSDHRERAGRPLPYVLPYEAYPKPARRADADASSAEGGAGDGIVSVVHMVQDRDVPDYEISSGFVIAPAGLDDGQLVVTCSHTLDQLCNRHPHSSIHSFVVPSRGAEYIPITGYPSFSTSDLLICSISNPTRALRSLPVSPYPIYKGQDVLVHEYSETRAGHHEEAGVRWKRAKMMGYRGYSWREVLPGTSSSLPYLTFSSRPSNGSSGGPIVDAESGAVIGVVSGSRTVSAVEGERGYGASAENIFELFSLPGFVLSSTKRRNV